MKKYPLLFDPTFTADIYHWILQDTEQASTDSSVEWDGKVMCWMGLSYMNKQTEYSNYYVCIIVIHCSIQLYLY